MFAENEIVVENAWCQGGQGKANWLGIYAEILEPSLELGGMNEGFYSPENIV